MTDLTREQLDEIKRAVVAMNKADDPDAYYKYLSLGISDGTATRALVRMAEKSLLLDRIVQTAPRKMHGLADPFWAAIRDAVEMARRSLGDE